MTDDFDRAWQHSAPFLVDALDGSMAIGHVYEACKDGRARLWPLERSAVVTELLEYPNLLACRVWLAGGDLYEIRSYLPALDNYARSMGCERIEVDGRRGWQKVLDGYELTRVVLTKEL